METLRLARRLYLAHGRRWFYVLALLGCALAGTAERLPEYSVKALFLYNFLKFTEWPGPAKKELGLCVFGADPFGEALDAIEGKTAHGLPVRIRRGVNSEEVKECHLVFVNEPDRPRLLRLLRQWEGKAVLTVGEAEDFVQSGGMIGLVLEESRVQFQVNLRRVEREGIKISAQLLKLARRILE